MTKEQTIDQFRKDMAAHGVTFLLIYSSHNLLTGKQETMLASNSTQDGVQQIMAAVWAPTEKAVGILARELESGARASLNLDAAALDKAAHEGAFLAAASVLLEMLRPHYTIFGWEKKEQKPNSNVPQ